MVRLYDRLLGLVHLPASGTSTQTSSYTALTGTNKGSPPSQLTLTIKKDLNLTQPEVANSNIVSLCAT